MTQKERELIEIKDGELLTPKLMFWNKASSFIAVPNGTTPEALLPAVPAVERMVIIMSI